MTPVPSPGPGLPVNIMTGPNQLDQETNSMKSLLNDFEGSNQKLYKVKKTKKKPFGSKQTEIVERLIIDTNRGTTPRSKNQEFNFEAEQLPVPPIFEVGDGI
jgi:hypothetical protein